MEIPKFGISKGKIKFLLFCLLLIVELSPVESQFFRRRNRHRYRLLPTSDSDEYQESGSSTSTVTSSPTVVPGTRINSYKEILDPETGLVITWSVNRNLGFISLTIESNKKSGFVALALMKEGEGQLRKGADVVVVGASRADGVPYVLDMYAVDNGDVAEDDSQDWRLDLDDSITEDGMRVTIRRDLESCDDQDIAIGSDRLTIAYDQGDQDIPTQIRPQGIKDIAFLAPSSKPVPAANCPEERISHRTSPTSMVTEPSVDNSRIIRTANPLEDLTSGSGSGSTTEPENDPKEPATELENRSEYQDPAQDRYGHGYGVAHVKIHPFFHSLAYARLKWKFMLSKLKINKYFKPIKFKYVK